MNRLLLKSSSSSLLSGGFGGGTRTRVATVAAAAAMMMTFATVSRCQQQQKEEEDDEDHTKNYRIEVHLMDKIQQKSYLQEAKDGIPSTLRILAIDLPEMRTEAFSCGECRLSHESIFVDDIAPPKTIQVPTVPSAVSPDDATRGEEGDNDKATTTKSRSRNDKIKIAQKALVKSLVYCRSNQSQQRVGVELLEASVAGLNKYELRKTHQFGNYKYDPGKYYHRSTLISSSQTGRVSNTRRFNTRPHYDDYDDDEMDELDQEEDDTTDTSSSANGNNTLTDIEANYEDEIEAPWNQYAWAEEMRLRIQGHVKWNAPMERSSRFQRLFFGHAYKVTIPPVSRFWEFLLPQFAKSDPDGIDGSGSSSSKNRAANKPHAVVANGAALQRVPSALRLLQKLCRKADVPLFVIHDPRVWGGNTHQSLSEALKEMRSTIKNRVISKALQQRGSSAFTRGRMLGQIETETKWQVKEQTRKTKEMLTGGGDSTRRRKSDIDWSKLDSTTLEKKFISKGLIQKKQQKQVTSEDNDDDGGEVATTKTYSVGLIQLAQQVCIDEEERQSNSKSTTGEEDDSAQEASRERDKPTGATVGATVHT